MITDVKTIPVGYKQTEIGVIPEDWDVKKLKDIANYRRGSFPQPYGLEKWYDNNFGMPFVQVVDVDDNFKLKNDTKQKISKLGAKLSVFVKKGTIILTIQGSIGRVCITQYDSYVDRTLLIFESFKEQFDKYFFMLKIFRKFEIEKEKAPGGIIKTITKEALSSFEISYPQDIKEQTAIATALSDTDALIEKLEKLIAKKKAIKQGAMRQLLNPYDCKGNLKKGWKFQSLFDLADSKKDLFDDGDWIEAEHITSKGVRLIQTGNIGVGKYVEKEQKKYIYEESFERLKCKLLKQGDLLICRLAEPAGRACVLPNIGDIRVIASVDVTIFRPKKEVANRYYLANLFSTDWWFKKVNESVGGTTHKRISRGALGKIVIPIPTIDDQILGATVLSDMDAEIEKLENKLGKYRQIKTGMMQQLLTGKIRLLKK